VRREAVKPFYAPVAPKFPPHFPHLFLTSCFSRYLPSLDVSFSCSRPSFKFYHHQFSVHAYTMKSDFPQAIFTYFIWYFSRAFLQSLLDS
jgi:hypothetical protein